MTAFTRSPIDSTPTTLPPSTTGRCRNLRSVISIMQVLALSSGDTEVTGDDMICQTGVSALERPLRITLRA